MKKLLALSVMIFSTYSYALSPKLDPVVALVEECLSTEGTLLCNDEIQNILKTVSLDARGEFVYYLKDLLNKNENEKVIVNLYNELQVLVPVYEELDGCSEWSCRDMKIFLGDVSTRYVKVSEVNKDLYIELYKSQAVQSGRYALLTTISERAQKATKLSEMDQLVEFAEFAKDYSRSIKDEYYLYQAGVAIVRDMTLKALKIRPGHEGVYKITFSNPEVNKVLKIDAVTIMESNDRDALVVNFSSTKTRVTKVAFKQSGILGNTFFSNEDVYHNENNQEVQSPYFKLELDRETKTVKGVFSNARFGKSEFTGTLVQSNLEVYSQANLLLTSLEDVAGSYSVKVGQYDMTLVIEKRADERSLYEAYLISPNALISFSKVTLDEKSGVISIVDSRNERKLSLGLVETAEGKTAVKGLFINGPLAKIETVKSN